MAQAQVTAGQAAWVQIGTDIAGRFFVQNVMAGGHGPVAMVQATAGTTAPTSAAGAPRLLPLKAYEGDSLAVAFGVADADTLWARGFDGTVNVTANWA